MNKARRTRIATLVERMDEIRAELEEIQGDEQEAFDNLPESIAYGERGDRMQEAIDELGEALSYLEEVQEAANRASE